MLTCTYPVVVIGDSIPRHYNVQKFDHLVTVRETAELIDIRDLCIAWKFKERGCFMAYGEYKIARQIIPGGHDHAYQGLFQIDPRVFNEIQRLAQYKKYGDSWFNYIYSIMQTENRVEEFTQILETFDRTYGVTN